MEQQPTHRRDADVVLLQEVGPSFLELTPRLGELLERYTVGPTRSELPRTRIAYSR